jgi:hypothetical protein
MDKLESRGGNLWLPEFVIAWPGCDLTFVGKALARAAIAGDELRMKQIADGRDFSFVKVRRSFFSELRLQKETDLALAIERNGEPTRLGLSAPAASEVGAISDIQRFDPPSEEPAGRSTPEASLGASSEVGAASDSSSFVKFSRPPVPTALADPQAARMAPFLERARLFLAVIGSQAQKQTATLRL